MAANNICDFEISALDSSSLTFVFRSGATTVQFRLILVCLSGLFIIYGGYQLTRLFYVVSVLSHLTIDWECVGIANADPIGRSKNKAQSKLSLDSCTALHRYITFAPTNTLGINYCHRLPCSSLSMKNYCKIKNHL
jgi:hypothetical protein